MATNALHLHFDENPFVDSSGQNKIVNNYGVVVPTFGAPPASGNPQPSEFSEIPSGGLYDELTGETLDTTVWSFTGGGTGGTGTPSGSDGFVMQTGPYPVFLRLIKDIPQTGEFDIEVEIEMDPMPSVSSYQVGIELVGSTATEVQYRRMCIDANPSPQFFFYGGVISPVPSAFLIQAGGATPLAGVPFRLRLIRKGDLVHAFSVHRPPAGCNPICSWVLLGSSTWSNIVGGIACSIFLSNYNTNPAVRASFKNVIVREPFSRQNWFVDEGTGDWGDISTCENTVAVNCGNAQVLEGGGWLTINGGFSRVSTFTPPAETDYYPSWAYHWINGDFDLFTHISADYLEDPDEQGGILVELDRNNWFKFIVRSGGPDSITSIHNVAGVATETDSNNAVVTLGPGSGQGYNEFFLRVRRVGTTFQHYVWDWANGGWIEVVHADAFLTPRPKLTTSAPIKFGLFGTRTWSGNGVHQPIFRFNFLREWEEGVSFTPGPSAGSPSPSGTGELGGETYLQVPKANSLTPVNNTNWETDFIISHTDLAGTQTYYSQYEDANNRCHLQHINGTGLEFLFRYGGVDLISLTGSEITDTSEHHIALTKEDDTFRLFLDGILQDTTTYTLTTELIDSDIFIGQDGNSENYLSARMRNFRISNVTRFINIFSPNFGDIETDEDTQLLITFATDTEDSSEAGLPIWNPTQVTRGNVDTGLRIYRFGNQCGFFPGSQDGFSPYSLQLPDHPNWYIADKDFTLDAWLHPLSHFNYAGLMHQNTRWYWYIDSAGKLNFYIQDGSNTFSLQTAGTVPLNEWSHAALTRRPEYRPPVNPTYDPDYTNVNITLSNGNLTATYVAGVNISSYATDPGIAGGKYYWEYLIGSTGFYQYVGCGETRTDLVRFPDQATGYAYRSDGNKYSNGTPSAYGATWGAGNVIGVALDLDNGKIFFAKNNVWQNSGDPVAGTNPAFSGLNAASHYPAVCFYYGANSNTIRFQSASFSYTPPTGYEPLAFAGGDKQIWRMYIKGVKEVQKEQDFTIPNLTGPMWIGRGTTTSDLYHGYMDELRLLLNKAIWTEDEFWPFDYPYFDEAVVHRYRRMHRRRIHAIQGR